MALNQVDLRPQLTATITAIHFKEGYDVSAAQLLFTLDDGASRYRQRPAAVDAYPHRGAGGSTHRRRHRASGQPGDLNAWAKRLMDELRRGDVLAGLNNDAQYDGLDAQRSVNREQAAALGVDMATVRNTLYAAYGTRQVSTIYALEDSYQVIMELAAPFRRDESSLTKIQVRNASGTLVPLHAFTQISRGRGTMVVNHQGQLPAVTIWFDLAPGKSLSDATAAIAEAQQRIGLPSSIFGTYAGAAALFQQSQSSQLWLIGIDYAGAVPDLRTAGRPRAGSGKQHSHAHSPPLSAIIEPDRGAVVVGNIAHNRQAQAATPDLITVRPEKAVKHAAAVLRRHARSVVAHLQERSALLDARQQVHPAAALGVTQGIVDQIVEQYLQAILVGLQQHRRRAFKAEVDVAAIGQCRMIGHHRGQQRIDVDRLQLRPDQAGFMPCQAQQLSHQMAAPVQPLMQLDQRLRAVRLAVGTLN